MSLTQEECINEYKPGSIRRIKLQNFLTYTNVEFYPGPRLNMVVGPNGTGKSTILCAICLGLGGEPKLLGRADDARLFINHEQENAAIEIELAPQPGSDVHVFRREIDRNKGSETGRGKGASTFYINGSKTSAKEIRRIVSDVYHISVDNMCTFLPQDRVGSFSGFDAQALLIETEKSLSSSKHLYETHQKLIEHEEDLRKGGNEKETIEAKLQGLVVENERLEREKERMEEREKALEQMELLQKKMLWLQFDTARNRATELKDKKNEAKDKVREAQATLIPLEEKHTKLATQEKRTKARFQSLDVEVKKLDREMEKHKSKAETHLDEIEDANSKLSSIDAQQRNAERLAAQLKDKVEQLEAQLKDFPSKEEVDQAVADAHGEMRSIKPQNTQARQEIGRLKNQYKELEDKLKRAQSKLERTNDEKKQRKDRIFRQQPKLHSVYKWVEENRKHFRRPVWGPIMCEVNPKTQNAAAFLEQHVPNTTLKAFVVECREDSNFLYREVREKLNLPVNIIEVSQGKLRPLTRMYSDSRMQTLKEEHGVLGYMDESFTAPDAIVEALRSQASVHNVLIGNEKTQESIDRRGLLDNLSKRENGSSALQGCCVFTNHRDRSYKYTSTISRYSGKPSTRIDDINQARMMAPGVNPAQKAAMEKTIQEVQGEMDQLVPDIQRADSKYHELNTKGQLAAARMKEAKNSQTELKKFQQRLTTAKRKWQDAEEAAASDNGAEKKKLLRTLMARIKSNVAALETHAACHAKMMKSTYTLAGVKISQDGLGAAVRKASMIYNEKRLEFDDMDRTYKQIVAEFQQARDIARENKMKAEAEAPLTNADGEELPLRAQLDELPVETLEDAEVALEDATAKANAIDANPDVMRQYEARKIEIEETREQLEKVDSDKNSKVEELTRLREPWQAALSNSVQKVNILFAKYMRELGCAGEVTLFKGDETSDSARAGDGNNEDQKTFNFKKWGIEIKVKFREKSDLQVLSAQVQSGGERSVSTIMYLMALQELMVSPFRCVDEINQGLDERNERLVFKRIVANSTKPPNRNDGPSGHSGQYFLITPKLLPNLYDMENEHITVLFIFNGPHNFKNPLDWNAKKFIEMKKREHSGVENEDESEADEDEADENSSSGINKEIPRKASKSQRKKRRTAEELDERDGSLEQF